MCGWSTTKLFDSYDMGRRKSEEQGRSKIRKRLQIENLKKKENQERKESKEQQMMQKSHTKRMEVMTAVRKTEREEGDREEQRQGRRKAKMGWEGKTQRREDWSLACRSKRAVSSSSRPVLPAPAAAPQPSQTHYSSRRTA